MSDTFPVVFRRDKSTGAYLLMQKSSIKHLYPRRNERKTVCTRKKHWLKLLVNIGKNIFYDITMKDVNSEGSTYKELGEGGSMLAICLHFRAFRSICLCEGNVDPPPVPTFRFAAIIFKILTLSQIQFSCDPYFSKWY